MQGRKILIWWLVSTCSISIIHWAGYLLGVDAGWGIRFAFSLGIVVGLLAEANDEPGRPLGNGDIPFIVTVLSALSFMLLSILPGSIITRHDETAIYGWMFLLVHVMGGVLGFLFKRGGRWFRSKMSRLRTNFRRFSTKPSPNSDHFHETRLLEITA